MHEREAAEEEVCLGQSDLVTTNQQGQECPVAQMEDTSRCTAQSSPKQSPSDEFKEDLTSPPADYPDGVVPVYSRSESGQSLYSKRQICYFCQKPVAKIERHWNSCHAEEKEVATLAA